MKPVAFAGASLLLLLSLAPAPDWGFFAHRHINRLAVYTLPPAMMPLFKTNIDYLAEHAVDPDKRRYAVDHEAVRHYIDLDHWGSLPFEGLPRTRLGSWLRYGQLQLLFPDGDSLLLADSTRVDPSSEDRFLRVGEGVFRSRSAYRSFFARWILPGLSADSLSVPCDSLRAFFALKGPCGSLRFRDEFAAHGLLPFHLASMQRHLTEAFQKRDRPRILKLAAELGHYLADAHVPLHTTENYDGQLSGQRGIHAFWESRIPELFAEAEYDFLVGKARYIDDPPGFFWEVVLASHRLVERVLAAHRSVRAAVPEDDQWCFGPRGIRVVRQPCQVYARAYQRAMEGMVEQRMRASMHAIGSAWYTAWVDAGQPDLQGLGAPEEGHLIGRLLDSLFRIDRQLRASGRRHE